jgi:hypothetical protein
MSYASRLPTRSWLVLLLVLSAGELRATAADATGRLRIEIEGAAAWQTRNHFAVPRSTGTRVELRRDGADPVAAGRVTLWLDLGERWTARALAAPLRVTETFVRAEAIRFQDATFAAGVPVEHRYQFDSYRVSVLRRLSGGARSEYRLGVTAKVRSAKLRLASPSLEREETDLGFVPLLHAGATFTPSGSWAIDLEVDALGAPQGYAVDGAARLMRSVGSRTQAFLGYRVLDGGADVDRVYSFATFHYALGGIRIRL